jgi:glycosyltransferase involved in cell wall biosynthesis
VGVGTADDAFPGLDPRVETVRLRRFGPAPVARALNLGSGIGSLVRQRPNAVIHLFAVLPSYLTFAGLAAARRRGNPVVWTPMFHPARARAWGGVRAPMRVFDAAATRAVRFVDTVAIATDAEDALMRARGARETVFMPPVVEDRPPASAAAAAELRRRLEIGDAPLVVVVTPRDEPRKGLSFGFAAFEELRRRVPDGRLLVVGLRGAVGAGPGVVFSGRISDDDLAAALRAADVAFVPSLYEGFSRVAIEAWQQETPVVVTDGVGLAEVASRAGAVIEYGDVRAAAAALADLLAAPERAQALGEAGAGLVADRYGEQALLDAAEATYRGLLAHRGC